MSRPEHPDPSKCSWLVCQNVATLRCTRCRDADPPTLYCSAECQEKDWKMFHKKYCGKKAYMFEFELLGSSSPVIKRKVDVPSWYTFQELHYVIQYAFGPWQLCHLHEFNFTLSKPNRSGKISLGMQRDVLKLLDRHDAEEAEELITNARVELEDRVYLKDVFDPHGRLHSVVTRNGSILPLIYLYDFGDNWEHLITFKGEKLAVAARPLFSSAVGYGPAEDAGGVTGWQDVKAAFAASNPTRKQLEIRKWATEQMGMVGRDDPLAVEGGPYSPLKTPNVTVMNYDGRWVNHLEGFRGDNGEGH